MIRFIKFFCAGLVTASVQYGTFHVLFVYVQSTYLIASSAAFMCAVGVSFLLQRNWAFKAVEGNSRSQFRLFLGNAFLNLLLNAALMLVLVEWFLVSPDVAQVLVMATLMFYNFFIYRLIFSIK